MRRTLSSALTPVVTIAVPLWSAVFGLGVYRLLTHPADVVLDGVRGGASPAGRLFVFAVWAASTVVLGREVMRLRRVRVDSDGLLVSDYLRQVRVAFGGVGRTRASSVPRP